ncbi:MAG: YfiR family protein [Deltaproteobacteria bacterium]|nr:YfiR family protein [Deltaproteobacteria bacterium]
MAVIAACVCARSGSAASAPTEYQLKAAFLMNFAKFTDWPAHSFKTPQSPINICVIGDDPFKADLDDTVRGQTAGNRGLAVRRISQLQPGDNCHILFVGLNERERFERILGALKNHACLTVGEEMEFAQAGGMINLLVEDRKIRFEVSLDVAEKAGLKISSRLLKLAKTVRDRRKN